MRHNRWGGPAPSPRGWAPRWPGCCRAEAPLLRRRCCLRELWGDEGSQPGQWVRSGTVWRWGPWRGLRRRSWHRNTCGPAQSPETSLHTRSAGLRREMPSSPHRTRISPLGPHQAAAARLGAEETRPLTQHHPPASCEQTGETERDLKPDRCKQASPVPRRNGPGSPAATPRLIYGANMSTQTHRQSEARCLKIN